MTGVVLTTYTPIAGSGLMPTLSVLALLVVLAVAHAVTRRAAR